jgi:phosphotransferase system HPr (HPr) family protein
MTIERKLKVTNKYGLHSRPASQIVKIAQKFSSDSFLYKIDDSKIKADCKSVMSILLLGATIGTNLILECSGNDASIACKEISNYIENVID